MSNRTVPGWATDSSARLWFLSKNRWRWKLSFFRLVSQETEKTQHQTAHVVVICKSHFSECLLNVSVGERNQNASRILATVLPVYRLIFAYMWWKTWHVALSFFFFFNCLRRGSPCIEPVDLWKSSYNTARLYSRTTIKIKFIHSMLMIINRGIYFLSSGSHLLTNSKFQSLIFFIPWMPVEKTWILIYFKMN